MRKVFQDHFMQFAYEHLVKEGMDPETAKQTVIDAYMENQTKHREEPINEP